MCMPPVCTKLDWNCADEETVVFASKDFHYSGNRCLIRTSVRNDEFVCHIHRAIGLIEYRHFPTGSVASRAPPHILNVATRGLCAA